jgi:hypothetical protein
MGVVIAVSGTVASVVDTLVMTLGGSARGAPPGSAGMAGMSQVSEMWTL